MIAATGISVAPEDYSLTNENASEISSTMSAFEAAVSAAAAAEYAYRTAVVAKTRREQSQCLRLTAT